MLEKVLMVLFLQSLYIPIYSKRLIVLRDAQAANQVIELMISTKNVSEEKFLFQKLLISTMETVKLEVFSELNDHESKFAKNQRTKIVKKIAAIYFTMRLRHFCRIKKFKTNSGTRHKNTKPILFKNE